MLGAITMAPLLRRTTPLPVTASALLGTVRTGSFHTIAPLTPMVPLSSSVPGLSSVLFRVSVLPAPTVTLFRLTLKLLAVAAYDMFPCKEPALMVSVVAPSAVMTAAGPDGTAVPSVRLAVLPI